MYKWKKLKQSSIKSENEHPSNIEAEQALLGSILVNNDIIDEDYKYCGVIHFLRSSSYKNI